MKGNTMNFEDFEGEGKKVVKELLKTGKMNQAELSASEGEKKRS
jgi:hypothetical protein